MFPKFLTTSDSALLTWGNGWTASEMVDESHPSGEAVVDEVQASHIASVVDESHLSIEECSGNQQGTCLYEGHVRVGCGQSPTRLQTGRRHLGVLDKKGSSQQGQALCSGIYSDPRRGLWENLLTDWSIELLRSLISFAASRNYIFHQIDVKSALLNAPLVKTVYLFIPQGWDEDNRKTCPRLNKMSNSKPVSLWLAGFFRWPPRLVEDKDTTFSLYLYKYFIKTQFSLGWAIESHLVSLTKNALSLAFNHLLQCLLAGRLEVSPDHPITRHHEQLRPH
ncbi:hypothetical protein O181_067817 [Austropuccinia psidii MF-1]|uniref:Reverse transcriptase Ty1/copia-type domain-containing protein n=1 Tax=Austropuccinia psidii MF-1 TaxID=1389203 RepID=A0A9Q3I5P4_9BASI|nr:hypothetical protein [Austropuccinia psidii MF-1]